MRIIKQEDYDQVAKKVQTMQYETFPEDWIVNAPEKEEADARGGNGRATHERKG